MTHAKPGIRRHVAAGSAIAAMLLSASILPGTIRDADAGSINVLKGSWRGGGTVSPAGKPGERVSCRVNYRIDRGGALLNQEILCRGIDYTISALSKLNVNPKTKSISGSWFEQNFGKSGAVRGKLRGNVLSMSFKGDGINGQMTISMRSARSHTVSLSLSGQVSASASFSLHR